MKRAILVLFILFNTVILVGADYTKADKIAESVPQNLKTVKEITRYLTKGLNSPTDKVRAIYYWMAHAIRYDVTRMNSNDTYTDQQALVDDVLKTRKGVCANYAALFSACCQSAGVTSYTIEGYTRQNDKTIPIAHAWNAVKIDAKFYLIDVTWAAGYLKRNKYIQQFRDNYFLISPAEFIRTHMPFDPVWQFSTNPLTPKDFEAGIFTVQNHESNFNFSDSIQAMTGMSTLDRITGENRRMISAGQTNTLIRTHVVSNQQAISSEQYNHAADSFNKGVEKYNEYIQYKNKQFQHPTLDDTRIVELLASSRQWVESAEQALSGPGTGTYELSGMIVRMNKSIIGLKKSLEEEDKFVAKYVKTPKPLRILLFYKRNR